MQNTAIKQIHKDCQTKIQQVQGISFDWIDNPSIQKLLDVVVSIIAEEYIRIAKENPDVFCSRSGTTPNTYPPYPNPLPQGEKGETNKNGGWK